MERICFVFELNEGAEERYERSHDEIWPEMLELLTKAGVSDYSIFRDGTMLYAFLRADPDWASALEVIRGSEVQRRWNEEMAPLIKWQLDENGDFRQAKEVFRFDGQT